MPVDQTLMPVVSHPGEGRRLAWRGSEILFKSPTAQSGENWTVIEYTLAPWQPGAPPHYHKELLESFYVLSGRLWLLVGDRELEAGPGTLAVAPPGTVHSFGNRTDQPARFLLHASSPHHKLFLEELLAMIQSEPEWPPRDSGRFKELGLRYDTYYL